MPSATEAPVWLQQLIALGAFIGTAITAVWAGRKSKSETPGGEATVIAGSLVAGRQIDRVIEQLASVEGELREGREQQHRDSLSLRDCMDTLTRELRASADTHRSGMTPEFLALLSRIGGTK